MEKLYSEEECLAIKDKVKTGLEEEYSKNRTISGFLKNNYEHLSIQNSEQPYYYPFYRIEKKRDSRSLYARPEITRIPMLLYTDNNTLFQDDPLNSIYRQLANFHPCYEDKSERLEQVFSDLIEEAEIRKLIPYFTEKKGFITTHLSSSFEFFYNPESKKIYLDLNIDSYDSLLEEILKLYSDVRIKIDKDINLHNHTRTNEFKMRKGYANDGVVFRFYTDEHYKIFLEALSSNKSILQSLQKTNPFFPTELVEGCPICVIPDFGGSYDLFIAHATNLYISKCISEKTQANIKDFLTFLKETAISMEKLDKHHFKRGYEIYRDIAIEQIEKEMTKKI